MTHLSERADLGIFVLQDHAARQDGTPIGMRQCLAGVRVTDIPDPDGNTEPVRFGSDRQFGTIGDVHPWMFWQTRDRGTREMGSWAQVFGGMVVSASPQYGAAAVQPWRENWTTDPRYAFKNAGVAAGMSWYPEGSMLIFLPGTDENQQYEHAMWADSRLIAPNADGPGECGTLVCDLGAAGEICMSRSARPGIGGRHARLQTLMRVIAVPEQQSFAGMGAEGNVLALNYGWTGTDAIPGFGAVFGPIDGRSSGPITGGGTRGPNTGQASGSERGGRGDPRAQSVGNDPFGDPLIGNAADGGVTPNDIGLFRRNPTQGSGVGLMASMGPGGPLHLGNASDKHQLGFDADGHPINAGHISTTACYYHDGTFDAPIEFTPMMYPDPPGFPFKTRTHLFYDPKSFHAFGQGAARGLWRLWSEMPDMTPKKPPPITPRPPAPPLPPNDPPPPPGGPPTGGPPTGGPPTGGPPGGPPGGPGTGGPGGPGGGGPGGPGGGPITPTGRRPGDPRRPDPYPVGGGLDELPPDYPQGKHYPGGDQGGQGGTSDGPQDPGDGPTTGGGNGGNGGQGLCYDSDYRRRVSRNPASLSNSAFFSGNGYAAQAFIGRGNQIGARARSSYTGGSGVAFGTPGSDPREAMGRWSGLDPWTREPEEIPGLRERIGSQEPGQVGTYAMTRPLFWSTSAFAFRPQLWIDKYPNFERNPQLPESMWENDERVRPQTVVMRAWGMQSTGEGDWNYVERPMQSRARGGTVSGGVVFMPARFEFEDYVGIGVTQDVEDTGAATATDTHVLLAPGVNLSFGTPAVHGASPIDANAVRMYRDSSANNYAWRLEVAGVPAMRAYKLAGNPVVEFYNGTTWSSVGVAGIPDGEITDDLTIDGGSLFVYDDVSGGEAVIDLKNDAASGASGALQKIRTSGSSTGDAWTRYENPSRYFSVGLDTSTDEFRIGTGATLATGNLFRLTSAGVAHFVNDVQIGSTVSGSYSLIVNSGFSTQSDVELRQGGLTNVRIAALAAGGAAFQVDGASLGTPVTIWSVTTGNLLDMQGKRVTNAGDPTSAQDVATKAYVDAVELGDLDDVSAASAVSGNLLVYDGGQWVSVDYWHRDGWEQQTDHLFISNSSGASTFYHGGSDIEAGTPGGIVRAFSNTTAGAYTAARYKGKVLLGDGYVWECKMQVYGTTTSGTVRIGIGDSNTGAAPGEGAYFEYDQATSGNWRYVTVAGSTPTAATSSTAVSFSTWLTLRIEVGASSIEFFVDGVSIGSSSTNLPTSSGSQAEMFWLQVQNSAGNNTRAQVDNFRVWRAA